MPRGYHPRAVNSGNAFTRTTPLSFMNLPLLPCIKEISRQPILFIHGEKAHSRTGGLVGLPAARLMRPCRHAC